MKIYIMTDLEGPAMISTWEQTRDYAPGDRERTQGHRASLCRLQQSAT